MGHGGDQILICLMTFLFIRDCFVQCDSQVVKFSCKYAKLIFAAGDYRCYQITGCHGQDMLF